MAGIPLSTLESLSHSWHKHAQSWLIIRAVKTIANTVKAFFGFYSVNVLDGVTPHLAQKHSSSWFSQALRKPMALFKLTFLLPELVSPYIAGKLQKLKDDERIVQCRLVFSGDHVGLLPSYRSKNDPAIKLNCKVQWPGEDKTIACRHLAQAYIGGTFGRGKSSFLNIDSPFKLKTFSVHLPNDKKLREDNSQGIPDEAYYFDIHSIHDAIETVAAKYWNLLPDGQEKCFMFDTADHAMGLRFKKQKDTLKVIFYDPNYTDLHCTYTLTSPKDAQGLTIDYLMAGSSIETHFSNPKLMSAAICSNTRTPDRDQCEVKVFGKHDPAMLFQALDFGHFGHGELSKNAFAKAIRWTEYDKLLDLLLAQNERGAHGLSAACHQERAQSVKDMVDLINELELDPSDIRLLLSGKKPKAIRTHLEWALRSDSAEIAITLIKGILANRILSCQDKRELLEYPYSTDKSMLLSCQLIESKCAEQVFYEYILAVANSDMPYHHKRELLLPGYRDGSFFSMVKLFRKERLIDVHQNAIKNSSLTLFQKQDILNVAAGNYSGSGAGG